MNFEGSKTQANLMEAFAAESQARNKYTFYAAQARKDGFEQIGEVFDKTADNEKEHAEIWFKKLYNNQIPPTMQNLVESATAEHYEWTQMYTQFSADAREEGFPEIAVLFDLIAKIENEHELRYKTLADNLQQGIVFSRTGETLWRCRNCGHLHTGATPPETCPVCSHPKAFFEVKSDQF